ncbi:CLPSL2 isoform 2 [Pongo abelii]|uniref:CLPSL2 isoform 2 n=1 Tax=Pongo abelii TaxID=9601 RepID=A0A2J8Y3E6_PONAB|nr:CLPSL2 isoform 2 [Pongo abelii]
MAAALALVAGVLAGAVLPLWSSLPQYKKKITDRCFHRSECYSGCCLMDLDAGGAFCAPRARITMICLPQWLELFKGRDCIIFIYEAPTPSLVSAHNQGSYQHHLPLPVGLDVHIQGLDVFPPVPYDLEDDAGWSLLRRGHRPWVPPTCSKSSS